jgi:hypothetical protein
MLLESKPQDQNLGPILGGTANEAMERSILKSKGQAFSDVVYKYSKKSF